MVFRDLKQGYPVHILDRKEVTVRQGKAMSVGFPRIDTNPATGRAGMVVDVTVDDGSGKTASYIIPDSLSVTYAGGLVLATGRDELIGEVEAMKSAAERVLESIDRQREIVEKSELLLAELNPAFKEKQESDRRFSDIEEAVAGVKGTVTELKEMFKKFLGEN